MLFRSSEEVEKPRYAKLRNEQRLDTITFEEAMDLFKLPRKLGPYEGTEVQVSIGRFGPYVRLGDFYVSIKKEDDPYTITYERAVELIEGKRKADAEKIILKFPEDETVQVLNGRWGPYIVFGERNIKIPKGKDPKSLTLEEIREIAENTPVVSKKKAAFIRRKATSR